jgi:hypothetical protein
LDRFRPGHQPFVGAVVPLAQRHLPPRGDSTLHEPREFSSYEGVLEPEGPGVWFDPDIGSDPRWRKRWEGTERVELCLTPSRIVLLRRGKARGPATR